MGNVEKGTMCTTSARRDRRDLLAGGCICRRFSGEMHNRAASSENQWRAADMLIGINEVLSKVKAL